MNKNFRITTLITVIFITVASANAQSGGETSIEGYPMENLSPEIIAQITHLMTYGDRFEKTIQQILLEAEKPDWE